MLCRNNKTVSVYNLYNTLYTLYSTLLYRISPHNKCYTIHKTYHIQDGGDPQSCLRWAYEKGFDDILSLLKRKLRAEDSSSEGSGSGLFILDVLFVCLGLYFCLFVVSHLFVCLTVRFSVIHCVAFKLHCRFFG